MILNFGLCGKIRHDLFACKISPPLNLINCCFGDFSLKNGLSSENMAQLSLPKFFSCSYK